MFLRTLLLLLIPAIAFSYTIVRKDGKTFDGELIQQNPQITLIRGKDGVVLRFRSDQIDWLKTTQEIRKVETPLPVQAQGRLYVAKELTRQNRWTGELITFDFKDVDVRDFFRFIAEISGLNMILDPAVKGTLTMKLENVPWDQALDLVCRTYGLGYQIEGNVLSVDK
jgi:hypothetical protein